MPKGGGFGGGMPNMNNLMKQAKNMQKKMEEMQEELEKRTLEVTSGGGAVKIVISGKKEISEIVLSPDVVDPDDVEMLQDLLVAAVNEAVRQAEEMSAKEMGKIMPPGMGQMPGLF